MLVDLEKIEMARQKVGADRTMEIAATLLNLESVDYKNYKACCPFHNENTPSFILNTKTMKFHCFGCSKNADLIDIFMLGGMTYLEAVQALFDEAGMVYSFGELGVKTKSEYRYPQVDDCGSKDLVYAYMKQRGISPATIDYAGVTQDIHGNIVFNYYDTNDVLCMCKYRPSHKIDKSKGEIKNWCQKDADTGESYLYVSNVAYRPRSARLYCRALLRWFTVHVPKPRMVRVVVVSLFERRSQMKYFISQIDTYSNVNLKGVALQKFLKVFAHKLLLTDEDRAAFLNWINDKVEQLDEEYPRSKQLRVSKTLCNGDLSLLVLFHPDSDPDKIIARFYIHKVKGECKHLNISSNEKGGNK